MGKWNDNKFIRMKKSSKFAEFMNGFPTMILGIFIMFICIHASKGKYGFEAILVRSLLTTVGFTVLMGIFVLIIHGVRKVRKTGSPNEPRTDIPIADKSLDKPIPQKFSILDIISWKYLLGVFVVLTIAYFALYPEYTFREAISQSASFCGWALIGGIVFYVIQRVCLSHVRKKKSIREK